MKVVINLSFIDGQILYDPARACCSLSEVGPVRMTKDLRLARSRKVSGMRIFPDEEDKMIFQVKDIRESCRSLNLPSFAETKAAVLGAANQIPISYMIAFNDDQLEKEMSKRGDALHRPMAIELINIRNDWIQKENP